MDEKDCTQDNESGEVKRKYANAINVLPSELVAAIQERFTGLLWIPNVSSFHSDRKLLVLRLKEQKVKAPEIARLAQLSPRRVRQIIQDDQIRRGVWVPGRGRKKTRVAEASPNTVMAGTP